MKKGNVVDSKGEVFPTKKGYVTKVAEFSPAKNSGLSLKDAKWLSPTPKIVEVNEATLPNTEDYLVIPRSAPHLQENITAGHWDIKGHTISLSIRETKELSVMDWLLGVNARRKSAEKSPFPDFILVLPSFSPPVGGPGSGQLQKGNPIPWSAE